MYNLYFCSGVSEILYTLFLNDWHLPSNTTVYFRGPLSLLLVTPSAYRSTSLINSTLVLAFSSALKQNFSLSSVTDRWTISNPLDLSLYVQHLHGNIRTRMCTEN